MNTTTIRIESITLKTAVDRFCSDLAKRLRARKVDMETASRYRDAVVQAADLCKKHFSGEFGSFGGQFTSHGPDHAARVLTVALQLAKRMRNPQVSSNEFFLLGIAAILHDIGMTAPLPEDVLKECKSEEELWNERRKRHGEATAAIIRECQGPELQVIAKADDDAYHTFLPHVCAAHCTSGFAHHVQNIRDLAQRRGTVERYASLSGILLLADEMDITCVRARPDSFRYHEFRSDLTKAHWWKHWLVSDAEIDGGIWRVTCADESVVPHAGEFTRWTKAKLEQQVQMLRSTFDHEGNDPLWRLDVSIVIHQHPWWKDKLPELTAEVLQSAQTSRLAIPGQRICTIIAPERIIDRVRGRDAILQPCTFFRRAIARRISHFRGQGQHVTLEQARVLYVEDCRNLELIEHATDEWLRFVGLDSPGVNLKLFVGEIGVGKTHFLSVFLHDLLKKHGSICENAILARAELTERDRNHLLDLQRCVAASVFHELDGRLGVAREIRDIMIAQYTPGVPPPIPSLAEEIESWDEQRINEFIRVVGRICLPNSQIREQMGGRGPSSMCLFIDNSDQIDKNTVGELYNWCNNLSGSAGTMLWVFLRPETFRLLQVRHHHAPIGLRAPEPIYAPTLKAVIDKRIETFSRRFKADEKVEVPWGPGTLCPQDVQKAVSYITNLALDTADHMLPRLTERSDSDGQPDLRAGLQGLLGILGSHVMTDDEYAMALLSKATPDEPGKTKARFATAGWPRVLEALILGRRVWFSSSCGAVENIFDPPNIQEHGDYFLLLHVLQCLGRYPSDSTVGSVVAHLAGLGYTTTRIHEALRHMTTRQEILEEGNPDDDPFAQRTFPLTTVDAPSHSAPYRDDMSVRITPWGSYHATIICMQAQYWKHMFYNLVLPGTLASQLDANCIHGTTAELRRQLQLVLAYLSEVEASWFHGQTSATLQSIGVTRVMDVIWRRVLKQIA